MTGETTPTAALAVADPAIARLIGAIGPLSPGKRRRGRPRGDAYGALLRAIVGQQLSTAAAATIFARVTELFGGREPGPGELLAVDPQALRDAGLSGQKVSYVRDLASHVLDGRLEIDRLDQLSDELIVSELTAVRGVGEWTAQVFMIFQLERPDVLPAGDLGIRKAVAAAYQLGELPEQAEVRRIGQAWRPHRTLASLYLWESLALET